MAREADFIARLRVLAGAAAARGLLDDAAVLQVGATDLVVTHDMIVEGVHFLPADPAGEVAWKLLAVNLSDLAAKGARPLGVLLGYTLTGDEAWDAEFVAGLETALRAFDLSLLGGDTVSSAGPRTLGLTALGQAQRPVPSREGAKPGDLLWVSGTIGDAGAGLAVARGDREGPSSLLDRYRLPRPRLEAGQRLAPLVSAMMDVSDGLLIDAARLASASRVAIGVEMENLPMSQDLLAFCGGAGGEARLRAATAGDDYELLFTAAPAASGGILRLADELGLPLSRIGRVGDGSGLTLTDRGEPIPLPERLGYQHG